MSLRQGRNPPIDSSHGGKPTILPSPWPFPPGVFNLHYSQSSDPCQSALETYRFRPSPLSIYWGSRRPLCGHQPSETPPQRLAFARCLGYPAACSRVIYCIARLHRSLTLFCVTGANGCNKYAQSLRILGSLGYSVDACAASHVQVTIFCRFDGIWPATDHLFFVHIGLISFAGAQIRC